MRNAAYILFLNIVCTLNGFKIAFCMDGGCVNNQSKIFPLSKISFKSEGWTLIYQADNGSQWTKIITDEEILEKHKNQIIITDYVDCRNKTPRYTFDLYFNGKIEKSFAYCYPEQIQLGLIEKYFKDVNEIKLRDLSKDDVEKKADSLKRNKIAFIIGSSNSNFPGKMTININLSSKIKHIYKYESIILKEFKNIYPTLSIPIIVNYFSSNPALQITSYKIIMECDEIFYNSFDIGEMKKNKVLKNYLVAPYETNKYTLRYFLLKI